MAKTIVHDIVPGARYEQKGGFTWQVIRLINFPGEDTPHVQLFNERDTANTKTVSVNALMDRGLFRRIESKPAPAQS